MWLRPSAGSSICWKPDICHSWQMNCDDDDYSGPMSMLLFTPFMPERTADCSHRKVPGGAHMSTPSSARTRSHAVLPCDHAEADSRLIIFVMPSCCCCCGVDLRVCHRSRL